MSEHDNSCSGLSATIVIATVDRSQMVLDCIKSFKEQTPGTAEVLVVDAGSEAPVEENALRQLWANSRVLKLSVRNAGLQRNEGVRHASGDIIIFLDDDTYVQRGWWPAIIEPFTDKSVGAVAGAIWCNPKPQFTDIRGGYVNIFGEPVQVTHRGKGAPREVDWPLTTNMAVRKAVYEQVGGIAGVYGIYDEDVDLGLKIRKAGWRIVFQPDAAVYHYFLRRPKALPTKQSEFRLGRNRSILLVRNYGLSLRLLLFLLTGPLVRLCRAAVGTCHAAMTCFGHAAAYVIGCLYGVGDGLRHPVGDDVDEYNRKQQG
jgi:GT2 family glycosyltransferase